MKRTLFAIAAMVAMVACNNDYVVNEAPGEAIEFGNVFVDNATRADVATDPSINNTNFKEFQVWGTVNGGNGLVAIYNYDDVTGTVGYADEGKTTPNVWHCDVKQYWINGAKYNFAALANAAENNVTLGEDQLPATVKFNANGSTDLVYARSEEVTGKESGNGPVNFTFNHLLSKVKFTVNNGSTTAEGYSFEVRDIYVSGATEGTCTLANKTWSEFNTASDIEFGDIIVANADDTEVCDAEKLLIPGDVQVKFVVAILCDGTEIGTKVYDYNQTYTLEVGRAYNFQIGVAVGEEITFSVTETPGWGETVNLQ